MSTIANFASGLGKYDGSTLVGAGTTLDPSAIAIGNSDLSLNSGYLSNPNAFTTPAVGNGNGFTVTGWFNPGGAQASNFTPIFDMSGASVTATNHATLCVSGNSLTPSLVGNFNNQGTITVASGVLANAWNFFGYTVCCSGGTQLVQNLTVNGTTTSLTGGTYSALNVANTYVGYGLAPFNNYFNGKIDDFRYYGRVLCPMEMRVLYSYAYGKSVGTSGIGGLVTKITPILGTVTVGTLTATTAPLIFPSTGTYSYVGVTRTFAGVTSTFIVNASALALSGSSYTWTDTTVAFTSSPSASYVITPYILGTPGLSQALTAMIPAPSAITSILAYNAGVGVFDVSWIGGVGVGVTYLYDVSSSGAIVDPANYTTTALGSGGVFNPTRITLANNAQKTYTVVVKATNVVGTVSSSTSGAVTTVSPIIYATANKTTNSGATKTTNGAYTVFTYTSSSTFTVATGGYASVLIVGGGGGGGYNFGGGGGASGLVYFDLTTKPMPLTAGSYTVTVGSGGGGGYGTSILGNNGVDSVFNGFTAKGGGGGAYNNGGGAAISGGNGGCGGGSVSTGNFSTSTQSAYVNALYVGGFSGGNAVTGYQNSGGGGGAGAVGSNGTSTVSGSGGIGYSCTITGNTIFYAGGGGGGFYSGNGGNGGNGGGGNGGYFISNTHYTGSPGQPNSGGGGGGGGSTASPSSGVGNSGGSGVVIILCNGV